METYEPIEAAAALEAVRDSRARVAWAGYPAWYWLTTGAGLGAMTRRDAVALYGPMAVVILASAAASKVTAWSPWPMAVGAVLVFLLFAGTGLTLTARATRP